MKNYKSLFAILVLFFNLGLVACTQSDQIDSTTEQSMQAHPSKLVGSLVKPELNSPEIFFKDVVNERSNFKVETKTQGQEIDQFITNDDGTFNSVVFWKDTGQGILAKGIIVNIAQPMNPDNVQVLKRLALRLNDSEAVENAINQNMNFIALNNGAGISIKEVDGRKQYEIY